MNTPYGGKLVSLRNHAPPADGNEWPAVALTATEYLDLHLMADGVFSPVESFFNAEQTRQVMEESRLDRHVWSVPILLSEKDSQHPPGQGVRLTYDGVTQATGVLCDRFSLDEKAIHGFLGTSDAKHPGLKFFSSSHYQGLTHLNVFGPTPAFAKSINPRRARQIFDAKKWKTIAVFHTRNFPHLGHEHL
ncbi:MAG TPA: hypothetical protein VI874_01130, partial [Candidatus Norongarragalinales archaeon]|nr:hypothetical protein [Candidatus Norongarragalinales archaeon]